MREIWKPIKNIKKGYEVSNRGRARQKTAVICGRIIENFLKSLSVSPSGLLYFGARDSRGRRVNVYLHKAVAAAFVPNPDGLRFVRFKDGNPFNCRPSNLEWSAHRAPNGGGA